MELSPKGCVWEKKQVLSGRKAREALEISLGTLFSGGGSELY